ncbi:acetyl-CoA carboxylase biotin carboxyl carrier protein [Thermostilla marina]
MGDAPNQDVFDVRRVRRLVQLMDEHELSEIDLRDGELRIRIRRGKEAPTVTAVPATPAAGYVPPYPVAQPPAPVPAGESKPAADAAPAEKKPAAEADDENIAIIRSPLVGTFYAAPDPDSPPYVKVGDSVGPDTIVCIVEAMKVFNEIPAEISGKIVAVLVENGEPVEFGQPLFKVDTKG